MQVTEFDDYVLPNEVVESGEMDANYFQHVPYLDSFNEEKGTHLVEVGKIHYEPFGIYPGTKAEPWMKLLMEIPLQYRTTLPTRHVHCFFCRIMESSHLKDGAGLTATVNDIAENPHNVKIEELEAAESVARVADEVALRCIKW